uniref:TIL domain-containing protein n=1 Tax=Steinernema glaseri TaxID=37863 RepID=A0A1I8A280_9BILA
MFWRRRSAVLSCLLLLVAVSQALRDDCGENEVFDKCGGACEDNCRGPQPCLRQMCRGGCRCKEGFARDDELRCISRKECAKDSPMFDY